jgi:glycosyltransferase involved in cell wall biosynthesis
MGGAERSLSIILQHLNRKIWTPYLVCSSDDLAELVESINVDVYRLLFPRLRGNLNLVECYQSYRKLEGVIKQLKPRFIVSNTVRAALYGIVASWFTKIPHIWYMRDFWISETEPKYIWFDSFVKKMICKSSILVVTNSRATAEHLPATTNIRVVHNSINVRSFDQHLSGDEARNRYNITRNEFVIGIIGRLRPWKGQDRFIRIASRIVKQHPETKFLIVGGDIFGVKDQYQEYLKNLVLELNLSDRVFFTGHLEDVRPAFAAMDVFVHPGDPEPFGLVNIEAMAMEKPVVAFAHGALPEIVENGKTGLLVTPYDDEELAEAVISLLKNPTLREKMGSNGRVRVQKYFNVQRMVSEIEEVFIQTIGE